MGTTLNLTLTTELGNVATLKSEIVGEERSTKKFLQLSINKVQVVSSYLGLVIPVLISFYHSWTNKQRHLLNQIRKQFSTVDFELILKAVNVGGVLEVTVSNRLVRTLLRKDQELKECPEKSVQCEVLHDPGEDVRDVDIIFIHGIKGALDKTWTQGIWRLGQLQVLNLKKDTTWEVKTVEVGEERSVCWPKDWLPKDCPTARVIALNYTTDPYLWRPFFFAKPNRTNMEERSWEMINNLTELGVGKNSIVWVGHSKGGLYVKQMLVNACEMPDGKVMPLAKNTKAIMFYSVPHRGSILANLTLPLFRKSIELIEVQKNCKDVLTLHRKFLDLLESKKLEVEIESFIETRLTLMGIVYVRIVEKDSADAEIGELYGVPLDHRNICKPKNRECFLYKELVKMVKSKCGK